LFHLDGRVLLSGRKRVALHPGESMRQKTLNLAKPLAKYGRDHLYLRIALDLDGRCVSERTVFLTAPRFLDLPRAKTTVAFKLESSTRATVTFQSPAFQHRFAFELAGVAHFASDNYFELYPNEPKTVALELARPQTLKTLQRAISYRSLADTC